jgi:YgiT-type zinc finger domain-containing protein
MRKTNLQEMFVEKNVTYIFNLNGQIVLIENVPARVNEETGEEIFSPSTVEQLQKTILETEMLDRFVQDPVYNYLSNVA